MSLAKIKADDLQQVFPLSTVSRMIYEPGVSLLDLGMKAGCFKTEGKDILFISFISN